MGIETLYDGEWLSLRKLVNVSRGIEGYVYAHETRCAGRIVVVMPFRVVADDPCEHVSHEASECATNGGSELPDVHIELLLIDEVVPCWATDGPSLSSITGGWEFGDDIMCRQTATRELHEEAGFVVGTDALISLGIARGTKSSDTVYFIYGVNLTEVKQTDAGNGDGSALEAIASTRWVDAARASESSDSLVHAAANRLRVWFFEQFELTGDDTSK